MSEQQLIDFTFESTSRPWKALTSFLTNFNNEVSFKITTEGIGIKIMDPSHASVMICQWNKELFQKFETNLESGTEQYLTLNVDVLGVLFKRFKDDEIITITFDPRTASIVIRNGNKEFQLRTIEGEDNKQNPPNIPYENQTQITIAKLKDMIADAKVMSASSLWFNGKDAKLTYEAKDDSAGGSAKGSVFEEEFITEISNTAFQLDYLEPIISAAEKYCKEVTMQLKKEAPLHLIFPIEGLGEINYWLGNFSK